MFLMLSYDYLQAGSSYKNQEIYMETLTLLIALTFIFMNIFVPANVSFPPVNLTRPNEGSENSEYSLLVLQSAESN